jgi:hypothetical protein
MGFNLGKAGSDMKYLQLLENSKIIPQSRGAVSDNCISFNESTLNV